jgi:hypothetical protein
MNTLNARFQKAWLAITDRDDDSLLEALHDDLSFLNLKSARYGLTLLHLACGVNNLSAARILVELGAVFKPDDHGRMPSIVAAEAEADGELLDYIADAEAKALGMAEEPEPVLMLNERLLSSRDDHS